MKFLRFALNIDDKYQVLPGTQMPAAIIENRETGTETPFLYGIDGGQNGVYISFDNKGVAQIFDKKDTSQIIGNLEGNDEITSDLDNFA